MPPETSIDTDRVDEAVLALLFLGICERDRLTGMARTWKSFDRAAMEHLYEKGLIQNPVSKAKSVYLTEEGLERGEQLSHMLFGQPPGR